VPLSTLHARTAELARDRRYIAVCRSGSRSRSATAQLRSAGLDVLNLKGGMNSWKRRPPARAPKRPHRLSAASG